MVATRSEAIGQLARIPPFIYICGCDGTGKSTQAKQLMAQLTKLGVQPYHLWLRFPFCLSLPLLAYARWRGYSWYEETKGAKHGYWEFHRSWLLRTLLPWVLLLDAACAAVGKVYLPLWLGKTIICERFVLDMLVDLAVAFDDADLIRRFPGRLYPCLLPHNAVIVVLDLDAERIRTRRADLQVDRRLEARLKQFRYLAVDLDLTIFSSQLPISEVGRRIWREINGEI